MPGCPSRVTRLGIRPTYHFQGNRYEDTIGTVLTAFFAAFLWAELRAGATGGRVARLCRIIRSFRAANYPGICIKSSVFLKRFSETIVWPFVALFVKSIRDYNRYFTVRLICKWNREISLLGSPGTTLDARKDSSHTKYIVLIRGRWHFFRHFFSCVYSCHGMVYLLHPSNP